MHEIYPEIPVFYQVHQELCQSAIKDVEACLIRKLKASGLDRRIRQGVRVGIAVGSRGISSLAAMVRSVAAFVTAHGGEAVIIPAMGSHGGASVAGQLEVLAHLGVTAGGVGAQMAATMDVVDYGPADEGFHAYFDREATRCDLMVVINRIKEHTDFYGKTESGILKMIAVGLGNHTGASYIHSLGAAGLSGAIPAIAGKIMSSKDIYGIGIVEDGYGRTARIEVMHGREIFQKEPELLADAKLAKAKLPFHKIDCLIIEEIGKNISGSGVDTKVIGRIRYPGVQEPESPAPDIIAALRLTPESGGNAAGVGLLDIISRKLFETIDFGVTFENAKGSKSPERYKTPMHFEDDEGTVRLALSCARMWDTFAERIVLIKNTASLGTLYVTSSLLEESFSHGLTLARGKPGPIVFDKDHHYVSPFIS